MAPDAYQAAVEAAANCDLPADEALDDEMTKLIDRVLLGFPEEKHRLILRRCLVARRDKGLDEVAADTGETRAIVGIVVDEFLQTMKREWRRLRKTKKSKRS